MAVKKNAAAKPKKPEEKPEGTIPVVANRRGYYDNTVIEEGEEFLIRSEDELGTWMSQEVDGELIPFERVKDEEELEEEEEAEHEMALADGSKTQKAAPAKKAVAKKKVAKKVTKKAPAKKSDSAASKFV